MDRAFRIFLSFVLLLGLVLPTFGPMTVFANGTTTGNRISVEVEDNYEFEGGSLQIYEVQDEEGFRYNQYVPVLETGEGAEVILDSDKIEGSSLYELELRLDLTVDEKNITYTDYKTYTGEQLLQLTDLPWNTEIVPYSADFSSSQITGGQNVNLFIKDSVRNSSISIPQNGLVLINPEYVQSAFITGSDEEGNGYVVFKEFDVTDNNTSPFSFSAEEQDLKELTLKLGNKEADWYSMSFNYNDYFHANLSMSENFSGKLYVTPLAYNRFNLSVGNQSFFVENLNINDDKSLSLGEQKEIELKRLDYQQEVNGQYLYADLEVTQGDFKIQSFEENEAKIEIVDDGENVVFSAPIEYENFHLENLNLSPGTYTAKIIVGETVLTEPFQVKNVITLQAPGYEVDYFSEGKITELDGEQGEEYIHSTFSIDELEHLEIKDNQRYRVDAMFALRDSNGNPIIYVHSQEWSGTELKALNTISLQENVRKVKVDLTEKELDGTEHLSLSYNGLVYNQYADSHNDSLVEFWLTGSQKAAAGYTGTIDGKAYAVAKELSEATNTVNFTDAINQAVPVSIDGLAEGKKYELGVHYLDLDMYQWVDFNDQVYITPGRTEYWLDQRDSQGKGSVNWEVAERTITSATTLSFGSSFTHEIVRASQYRDKQEGDTLYIQQKIQSGDFVLHYDNEVSLNAKAKIFTLNDELLLEKEDIASLNYVHLPMKQLQEGKYKLIFELNNPFNGSKLTFTKPFDIGNNQGDHIYIETTTPLTKTGEVNVSGQGPKSTAFELKASKGVDGAPTVIGSGTTDANGHFEVAVSLAEEGNYTIEAVFGDKQSNPLNVTVDKTAPKQPELTARKVGSSFKLTWDANTDAAYYEVYVAEGNGEFVKQSNTVTTNSYEFKGVNAGMMYRFKVVAYDQAGNSSTSNVVEEKVGVFTVSGTVTTGLSPLTEEATITLNNDREFIQFKTGQDGVFTFDSVPKGTYSVDVLYKGTLSRSVAEIVVQDQNVTDITIDLPVYQSVKFKVQDVEGKIIDKRLSVSISGGGQNEPRYITGFVNSNGFISDWSGKDIFKQLPVGDYTYRIAGKGVYSDTENHFSLNRDTNYVESPIVLAVNKVEEKTASLDLKIVDEENKPIEKADVTLYSYKVVSTNGYEKGNIERKVQGSAAIDVIASNDYYLTVNASGYLPYNSEDLDLTSNLSHTVKLEKGNDIAGTVKTEDGQAFAGGEISVWTSTGYYGYARTDEQGDFVLKNAPKTGTMEISLRTPGYQLKESSFDLTSITEPFSLTLVKERYLEGKTVSRDGQTVPFAWLTVYEGNQYVTSVSSDRQGNFRLYNLELGKTYKVHTSAYGYPSVEKEVTFDTEGQFVQIVLEDETSSDFSGKGNSLTASAATVAPGKTVKYRLDYKNNGDADALDIPISVSLPNNVELVQGSIVLDGHKLTNLEGMKVSPKKGEAGSLTFEAKVKEDIDESSSVVVATAKIGEGDTQKTFTTSTNILFVTLNAPEATSTEEVKVYGSAKPGTTVEIYDGSVRLGTTKVEGRWWHATVKLSSDQSTHTLVAKVIDGQQSYVSEPVQVEYTPEVPKIKDVNITAGWNRNVSINPNLGIATMAITEFTPIEVKVEFDKDVDSASVVFLGKEQALTKNGTKFEGTYPGGWTSFGERLLELTFKKGDKTYTVPLVEVLVLIDPSGFVFEGSMQNPLEGVTAIVEQGLKADGKAALSDSDTASWIKWDAEKYGQVNPQTTNKDGRYGWDVPQGNWRVIFSKDGYETYTSRHVVVPPPETQLNVPLAKETNPAVTSVTPADNATGVETNSKIEIVFDRPMNEENIESLIKVVAQNNANVPVQWTLEHMNGYKEDTDKGEGWFIEDETKKLSKKVILTPSAALSAGTSYKVIIDGNMKDYADKKLGADQEHQFTTKAVQSGGNSSGSSSGPSEPPTETKPEVKDGAVTIEGNSLITSVKNNKAEVTVNEKVLKDIMSKNDKVTDITINAENAKANEVNINIPLSALNGKKEIQFNVNTVLGSYHLPLQAMSTDLTAQDQLIITVTKIEGKASKELKFVSDVIDFSVAVKQGEKVKTLSLFTKPVERRVKGDKPFNANQSVAVRLLENGEFQAVPTYFEGNEAIIKSFTNSQYAVVENNVTFKDVQGDFWNKAQIEKLASKYIVQGKGDKTFGPNEATSRVQLAVLLTRGLGLVTDAKYDGRFKDVKGDEWFVPELMAAVEAGIIQGKPDGTFVPTQKVTRIQAAAMISGAMEYMEYNQEKLDNSKAISQFKDASAIDSWAKGDIERILQANIMSGKPNGNFEPRAYTTRAQMVKMLDEFLKYIEFINE